MVQNGLIEAGFRGTLLLSPEWPFKGAVLHNNPESVWNGKLPQMCHEIGENSFRENTRRPLLRKGHSNRRSLKGPFLDNNGHSWPFLDNTPRGAQKPH